MEIVAGNKSQTWQMPNRRDTYGNFGKSHRRRRFVVFASLEIGHRLCGNTLKQYLEWAYCIHPTLLHPIPTISYKNCQMVILEKRHRWNDLVYTYFIFWRVILVSDIGILENTSVCVWLIDSVALSWVNDCTWIIYLTLCSKLQANISLLVHVE